MSTRRLLFLMTILSLIGLMKIPNSYVQGPMLGRSKPLIGAIRWDGWYRGSPYVQNLASSEWHYRHPFFAKMLPDGRLEAAADSQEVMDQGIEYAAAGGIDFWIFNNVNTETQK